MLLDGHGLWRVGLGAEVCLLLCTYNSCIQLGATAANCAWL